MTWPRGPLYVMHSDSIIFVMPKSALLCASLPLSSCLTLSHLYGRARLRLNALIFSIFVQSVICVVSAWFFQCPLELLVMSEILGSHKCSVGLR